MLEADTGIATRRALEWSGTTELYELLQREQNETVAAYSAKPKLLLEHFNEEDGYRAGSYGQRLIPELIQNSADAMSGPSAGRLQLLLTDKYLYCANDGEPLTSDGMVAILNSHLSTKSNEDLGRFGLGFKSVLAVTSKPEVISRSVSFSFDREISRQRLAAVGLNEEAIPLLRLGWSLDPMLAFENDLDLARLADWASTIIRLPLDSGTELVQAGIDALDPHILLFLPMVRDLTVTIRTSLAETEQVLAVASDPTGWVTITRNGSPHSRWRVHSKLHYPSLDALAAVPKAIARPKIMLSYAAPEQTSHRGHFSAVFPLRDQTTARGILSAPWHISDDRSGLLVSKFNDEIIATFAQLILETLPLLSTEDDPGRSLEYLPVEPVDGSFHYDKELSLHIRRIAREYPCAPDCSGAFQRPGDLKLPNMDLRLQEDHVMMWSANPHTPDSSAHWTCYKNDTRRARLRALVRGFGAKQPNETRLAEWLDLMVRRNDHQSCLDALMLLKTFTDDKMATQGSRVLAIPTSDGAFAKADAIDIVFIAQDLPKVLTGIRRVHPGLLALPGSLDALEALGFEHLTLPRQFSLLLARNKRTWTHREWTAFWRIASNLTKTESVAAITEYVSEQADLRVPASDGTWRIPQRVLGPGLVSPRNASNKLDPIFAEEWQSILTVLGVATNPEVMEVQRLSQDIVFNEYKDFADHIYASKYEKVSSFLEFDQIKGVGPLWPLATFRNDQDWESLARWTRSLLKIPVEESWTYSPFLSRNANGAAVVLPAPHLWAASTYGSARTTWGERPLATSVAHDLLKFGKILPVVTDAESSTGSMPAALAAVSSDLIREALERGTPESDPWILGEFLAAASRLLLDTLDHIDVAKFIGSASTSQELLLVARSKAEVTFVEEIGVPHVACQRPEDFYELTKHSRFSDIQAGLSLAIVTEGAGAPEPVFNRFGRLRTLNKTREILKSVLLVPCKDIQVAWQSAAGTLSQSVDSVLEKDTFFFSEELADNEILQQLVSSTNVDLDEKSQAGILHSSLSIDAERRKRLCKQTLDVPSKLQALITVSAMKKMLPVGLVDLIGAPALAEEQSSIPQLFSSIFGESALEELSSELAAVGFETPYRWGGSTAARRFALDLGFPESYAGEPGRPREPLLSVPGPTQVKPLHDYQRQLVDDLKELIQSGGRGMLHLPTGAGKTRTAAQAVVEMVRSGQIDATVLWIAQSDELCEQAVSAFESLWRTYGDERQIDIHRYWGINDLGDAAITGPRIVVATDAKLTRQIDADRNSWLLKATALVIVDEAHLAMGRNYAVALRALGIDEESCARPLIGLTATPYRGNNLTATFELAAFFGHRKLAMNVPDPMAELQSRGILSRVDHEVLPGSHVELVGDELIRLKVQGMIPPSVMNRIAQDQNRMHALLEHITGLPGDWPVIVFTPSVQSARILAALLLFRGVPAVALSGETSPAVRRREVERFRRGDTRVLVNCDLFTRGFDAPNVRALYVGRPTFSPNAYLQMVGRGLRGPANGGSEKCLIVNFTDTFGEFGEDLAFKHLDFLWSEDKAAKYGSNPASRSDIKDKTSMNSQSGFEKSPGFTGAPGFNVMKWE